MGELTYVYAKRQWSIAVSTSACGVRGPRLESRRGRFAFIATDTAIRSLGHGLRLTAVTKSTQPCIPSGSLNRVRDSAAVRAGISPLPGGR